MLRRSILWNILFMILCMPVGAQNLVNNAEFHMGVEFWGDTPPDLVIAPHFEDWMGDPGSGGAEITNSASGTYRGTYPSATPLGTFSPCDMKATQE